MPHEPLTRAKLAGMIDHAVLAPDASGLDLAAACQTCRQLELMSLCVRPSDVQAAAAMLAGCGVLVGSVVGFPHGCVHTRTKAFEAAQAVADGAAELDMVLHVGRLKEGDSAYVKADIAAVVAAAGGRCVKVILECALLDEEQIVRGCEAARAGGAHFVKTSTGFAAHGARVEHVRLLRRCAGDSMGVKAAGGIRTLQDAVAMIEAGASRLGTSSAESILADLPG